MVYNFFAGPEVTLRTSSWGFVDFRDVAAQMVAGIKVTGKRRFISVGPWFGNKEVIGCIASIRPDLKFEGPIREGCLYRPGQPLADPSTAVKVLGFPGLIPWKQTITNTLEATLKWRRMDREWCRSQEFGG